MADIVLATLNAKYIHCGFGLRYLLANMGVLRAHTSLLEFDINTRPADIAEKILAQSPKIVGLGVYIWNTAPTTTLVRILKTVRPGLVVIVGGPEVSHETEGQEVARRADRVICGEADLAFGELCSAILAGTPPPGKILRPPLPDLGALKLPYDLYTEADLRNRVIYVETSRGCPFSCEFCLSSLDDSVRHVPLTPLLAALEILLERGARQLKFVDRTFNVHPERSLAVLDFLLERHKPGLFFHFEIVPDHLSPGLLDVLKQFPSGALQLEAGVQTFNPAVAERISRRQSYPVVEKTMAFLRSATQAHIHADLIAGLPGESLQSFADSFDRLLGLGPHEIQVGILKRLKGTPISRHDAEWEMAYSPEPPYEILQNKLLNFAEVQRLKRFARYWDLLANSGNFVETAPLIWRHSPNGAFSQFMRFSDWLFNLCGRTDSLALIRLMEHLHLYLTDEMRMDPQSVAERLWRDYQRGGRKDKPEFLRVFTLPDPAPRTDSAIPRRQSRHTSIAPPHP